MIPLDTVTLDLTDPRSVEANRRGELTPAQQARLANPVIALDDMAIGLFGLNLLRQAAHLQQDLHAPEIQSATGQLVLEERGYMADISERRLPLPPNRGQLLPGITYQFYYLPQSGAVLSAEEIQTPDAAMAREHLTDLLAQANQCDADALTANRQGRLATRQASRLFKTFVQGLILSAISTGVVAVFLVTFLAPPNLAIGIRLPGVAFAVLFGGLFVWAGVSQVLRAALDLMANRVVCVEGPVQKQIKVSRTHSARGGPRRTSRRFYYLINSQRFQVSERAYHALIEDLPYWLYYTPRSKLLMSIEPLAEPVRR
ncbi:hypothetical protein TFLX_02520 [Thermoflexales bacterium]|nr:hypothetical protein TFLX_02520 [Thermoflexales bacterium]